MKSTSSLARTQTTVVTLCFLLGLLNYLDRVVISFAVTPIQTEFGINNAQFGFLMSAFALGTLSVNGFSGWILDQSNVRLVWTVAVLAWSVVMILQGLAPTLLLFIGLRYLLGLGEGVNFPAMNRAMADWMDPKTLSRQVSLCLLGVPLALMIGGPLLSNLIQSFGWRAAFIVLGAAGILLGLCWMTFYRNAPKELIPRGTDPGDPPPRWRDLLRNPTLLATSWSFFAFGYVLFFGVSWLPGYLGQTYGMDVTKIGWFSVLPWGISLALIPVAGWISDRIMAQTQSVRTSRIHLIWICQSVAVLFFGALLLAENSTAALVLLSFAIGFAMMPNSPYYSVCSDLFPRQSGSATGILVTFFSASGIVSPLLTGWLSDLFGGFNAAIGALIVIVGSSVAGMIVFARPTAKPRRV
ncbi:MAG: MFS transporter [Verrucomicrobiota bacterium]